MIFNAHDDDVFMSATKGKSKWNIKISLHCSCWMNELWEVWEFYGVLILILHKKANVSKAYWNYLRTVNLTKSLYLAIFK